MRADVTLNEDTTTLFVRWEVVVELGEAERLARLAGSLTLRVAASSYVDDGGKFHERIDVDVPIHPHAGRRNRGQAKFRDPEARRRFVENLQDGLTGDVAAFLWADAPPATAGEGPDDMSAPGILSIPGMGTVIRREEWTPAR